MHSSRFLVPAIAALSIGIALTSGAAAFADDSGTATSTVPTPILASPANGSATTTANQEWASWNSVTDAAGGVTYVFQSSTASSTNTDGSFTAPAFTSAAQASTTISTAGTPDGTYYWHVQAADSTGATSAWSAPWSFTVDTAATTPATISGIEVSAITDSGATIGWNTDQASDSQIFYGTSAQYSASTTLDSTATSSHSVVLTGLAADTTYHFMVESNDANGMATSSDRTFMTASSTDTGSGGSTASSTPLALVGITTDQGAATADGSWNNGWEWTFHFTVPNDETQFALNFGNFAGSDSTIATANNIRYWSAESQNATSSDSAITVTSAQTYPTTMLDLTGDTDNNSANGRQVDLVVQMAVPAGTAPGSYSATWSAESTSTMASSTNH